MVLFHRIMSKLLRFLQRPFQRKTPTLMLGEPVDGEEVIFFYRPGIAGAWFARVFESYRSEAVQIFPEKERAE